MFAKIGLVTISKNVTKNSLKTTKANAILKANFNINPPLLNDKNLFVFN
jgi:hypothetical protein